MHSSWKKIFVTVSAVFIIGIDLALICFDGAFSPLNFKYTPSKRQEVDLKELSLYDNDLIRKAKAGGYEIYHGSGTIYNMSIGKNISNGSDDGTSSLSIMTTDGKSPTEIIVFKGSEISYDEADEDAGLLREDDEISFDYAIDRYDSKILIRAHVDRDPQKLQKLLESERSKAEQEAIAEKNLARRRAVISIVIFDIISIITAALLFLLICLIERTRAGRSAKLFMSVAGAVMTFAMWVFLLRFPYIPTTATKVSHWHDPLVAFEEIFIHYEITYEVFGQEYKGRYDISSDNCDDPFPLDNKNPPTVWYNPAFPGCTRVKIWNDQFSESSFNPLFGVAESLLRQSFFSKGDSPSPKQLEREMKKSEIAAEIEKYI